MGNFLLLSLLLTTLNSCMSKKVMTNQGSPIMVGSIAIFDLPLFKEERISGFDRYYLSVEQNDTIVGSIRAYDPLMKRKPINFNFFSSNGIAGYYSEKFVLYGCSYTDSFLVQNNKLYFSKQCQNLKTNILFEKKGDTAHVAKYFYEKISRSNHLLNYSEWVKESYQVRSYFLIRRENAVEYNCFTDDTVFCPVSFMNTISHTQPNSLFWHFLYIAHFSRY